MTFTTGQFLRRSAITHCHFAVLRTAGAALAVALIGCGGDSGTAPVAVAAVTVTPIEADVLIGQTQQLSVSVRDANGGLVTGRTVKWQTSTSSVATVSDAGVVTAVSEGVVTITATVSGVSGTATIHSKTPFSDVAGAYHVVSITGPQGTDVTSPFVLLNETIDGYNIRLEMPSGTINLGSDGRYSGTGIVNVYLDGVFQPEYSGESFPSAGMYTISGSTLTFLPADVSESTTTATISGGNTLTFSETDVDPSTGGDMTITIVAKK